MTVGDRLASGRTRHGARAEREKDRVVRGSGRLARCLCHGHGRGLFPSQGCAHTRVHGGGGAVRRVSADRREEEKNSVIGPTRQ
jgi:hypothetical protein